MDPVACAKLCYSENAALVDSLPFHSCSFSPSQYHTRAEVTGTMIEGLSCQQASSQKP